MADPFDQLTAPPSGSSAAPPAASSQQSPPDPFTTLTAPPGSAAIPPAPGQPGYVPPTLAQTGSALVQSGRDIAQSVGGIANWLHLGDPGHVTQRLQQQSQAWQAANYGNIGAQVTRAAGDIGATAALLPEAIVAAPEALAAGGTEAALTPLIGANAARIGGTIAGRAAGGAAAGGATNVLTQGGYMPPGQDYGPGNALTAGATGALGGAVLGGALGAPGAFRGPVSPALEAAAGRINYPLTLGDRQGGLMKNIEDVTEGVPLGGSGPMAQQKMAAMATTIGNEMGMRGPLQNIDDNMVANAEQNTSAGFQAVTPRLQVSMTPNLFGRLQDEVDSTYNPVPGATQSNGYNAAVNLRNRIYSDMMQSGTVGGTNYGTPGMMPGDRLQNLIRFRGPLWRMQNSSDPEVRDVANAVNESLFDAVQDPASGNNPADLQLFGQLRGQWKAQKQFGPLIQKTTDGLSGVDNPSVTIRNIIMKPKTGWDPRYRDPVTGDPSPMTDLAQVLGTTRPLKSSGTGRQVGFQKMIGIGSETGGVAAPIGALMMGDPTMAAHAFVYGSVPTLGALGAARYSRFGPGLGIPGAGWLGNQLTPVMPRTFGPMLGNYLMGTQQGAQTQ